MPGEKYLRVLTALLGGGLALAAGWLVLRTVLPWAAPFLVGLALAAAVEPAVRFLMQRLRVPRPAAGVVCLLSLVGAAAAVLGAAVWRLVYEAGVLLARLPALLAEVSLWTGRLEVWSYRFLMALPVQLREAVQEGISGLLEGGLSLPERLYDLAAGAVGSLAGQLPAAGLFMGTALLAAGFISAGWTAYQNQLQSLLPESWRGPLALGWTKIKRTLGGWLRAQCILVLVTFGELAVGLLLLRVELFLLLAALIALVDALPVFGTGTVLVPWAAGMLLAGQPGVALGLLALYGVVSFVHSLLEPKLVGEQMGLSPLAALAAMYVGFQVFGVAGMILAPLGAALVSPLVKAFFSHKNGTEG